MKPVAYWLAVALLSTAPRTAAAQTTEGSFRQILDVTGPVALEVTSGMGDIEIRIGTPGKIVIVARMRARIEGTAGEELIRGIEATPPVRQSGSTVKIGLAANEDRVSINYEIQVPPNAAVKARTGVGHQTVSGVAGPWDLEARHGTIRVRVPETAGFRLDSHTNLGELYFARPVTMLVQGRIDRRRLTGTVRGGDKALRVRTGTGDIRIE